MVRLDSNGPLKVNARVAPGKDRGIVLEGRTCPVPSEVKPGIVAAIVGVFSGPDRQRAKRLPIWLVVQMAE